MQTLVSKAANVSVRVADLDVLVHSVLLHHAVVDLGALLAVYAQDCTIELATGILISRDDDKLLSLQTVLITMVEADWRSKDKGQTVLHRLLQAHRDGNVSDNDALTLCQAIVAAKPELPAIKDRSGASLDTFLAAGSEAKELRKFFRSTSSTTFLQRYQLTQPHVQYLSDRSLTAIGKDTINEEEVAIKFLKDFDKWQRELKTRLGMDSDQRLLPVTGCALAEEAKDLCHHRSSSLKIPPPDSVASQLLQQIENSTTLNELKAVSSQINTAKARGELNEISLQILRAAYRARGSVIYSAIAEEDDNGDDNVAVGVAKESLSKAAGAVKNQVQNTANTALNMGHGMVGMVGGLFSTSGEQSAEGDGQKATVLGGDATITASSATADDSQLAPGAQQDAPFSAEYDTTQAAHLWYVGGMAEERCKEIVLAGIPGDFLVFREGTAGNFTICVNDMHEISVYNVNVASGLFLLGAVTHATLADVTIGLLGNLINGRGGRKLQLKRPALVPLAAEIIGGLNWRTKASSDEASKSSSLLELEGVQAAIIPAESGPAGAAQQNVLRNYLADYPFVIVMPHCQRSLTDVITHEHPGGTPMARTIAEEIILCTCAGLE